ncbi:hypothetical protein SODALDRAFT_108296 [Sodiomyces alkalinus F11]|uniref:Uncharacterized protein n=1 Tax=Sodiomyces alkalinus (strain CBS 110278 / VKM F-3762 / F11) TaxID=1314773 RepID=A0A3N2Q2E3_SODAK|nr:hypothetical protein SODALDRAFT_108296 [Sodiomyces alkalinus F11]ROT40941.1 hypothetical protein SODALDRAFT_108296 [Sodiomyces alkalinus F11]
MSKEARRFSRRRHPPLSLPPCLFSLIVNTGERREERHEDSVYPYAQDTIFAKLFTSSLASTRRLGSLPYPGPPSFPIM